MKGFWYIFLGCSWGNANLIPFDNGFYQDPVRILDEEEFCLNWRSGFSAVRVSLQVERSP